MNLEKFEIDTELLSDLTGLQFDTPEELINKFKEMSDTAENKSDKDNHYLTQDLIYLVRSIKLKQ